MNQLQRNLQIILFNFIRIRVLQSGFLVPITDHKVYLKPSMYSVAGYIYFNYS